MQPDGRKPMTAKSRCVWHAIHLDDELTRIARSAVCYCSGWDADQVRALEIAQCINEIAVGILYAAAYGQPEKYGQYASELEALAHDIQKRLHS